MEKKSNMKQAMYEMFGVGSDQTEKTTTPTRSANTRKEDGKVSTQPVKSEVGSTMEKNEKPVAKVETKPKAAASYLAPGTVFEGVIRSVGDVEIAGEFKGDIITEGTVIMHSSIQGNITASSLKLSNCNLTGDVVVNDTVVIGAQSKLTGNITAKDLICAGYINGDVKIAENMVLEKTAQINGNMATGTLAVEKGAVIKGSIEIKA